MRDVHDRSVWVYAQNDPIVPTNQSHVPKSVVKVIRFMPKA